MIQEKLAAHLSRYDIFPFHGSAIAADGVGYLFTADTGTGKSTHTRLWRQLLGERAVMINDDKPFLQITEDGAVVHGSPWSGKHGLDTNIAVPLGGICILERGEEDRIWRISPEEAMPQLRKQAGGADPRLLDRLGERVRLWHLCCTATVHAAEVAFQAMGR